MAFFPPTLTMMHLCIAQCTYWTPLNRGAIVEGRMEGKKKRGRPRMRMMLLDDEKILQEVEEESWTSW